MEGLLCVNETIMQWYLKVFAKSWASMSVSGISQENGLYNINC